MRGSSLALAITLVILGMPHPANTPDAWHATVGDPLSDKDCPSCARYSSAEFQRRIEDLAPTCSNRIRLGVREKLSSGFRIAVERVCSRHKCHALFSSLGTDGLDILNTTRYYPAKPHQEVFICRDSVSFSRKGMSLTWLCRRFAALPDTSAAVILIHEALHCAGLGEHSTVMTSSDTNAMVSRACGL